jgi:uncharacterized protein YbjT (DUF2867 family)
LRSIDARNYIVVTRVADSLGRAINTSSLSVRQPVLVVGATGRIGRFVVDDLLRRGASVRALARSPEDAKLPAEVEVVAGDLTEPASLDASLRGVDSAFVVWTAPLAAAAPAIDRIAAAAPSRVVFLSAPINTPHPFFQQPNPMRDLMAEIERLIAASGIPSTILRPGMLASNALDWWAPQIRLGDVVRWPYGAVETAPIDDRDLAAVAGCTLVDGDHVGREYVLTGPESLSQAVQLQAIGDTIGREIRFEELSPDEFRRETAGVWPPGPVDMLLSAWGAAVGLPAFVTSTVAEVTGKPARTFRQWASDNAAAFR